MRKTILTIWIAALAAGPAFAKAEKATEPNRPLSKEQARRLETINKDIQQMRARIEANYSYQIEQVRLRAAEQIEDYEKSQRALLASKGMTTAMWIEQVGELPANHTKNSDGLWLPNDLIAKTEKQIAEVTQQIKQQADAQVAELERQKQYFLTKGLDELRKRLETSVLKPTAEQPLGTLCGIVYGAKKRSALINRKIVHEGDIVLGVKIVKIDKRKVYFEKAGIKWQQKVGQAPQEYWQVPETGVSKGAKPAV